MSQRWNQHVTDSGLPPIRLHDARHTAASLALQAGVDVKVVSEELGHASTTVTLDIYQHIAPGMQEEAAGVVAALVDALPPEPTTLRLVEGGQQ